MKARISRHAKEELQRRSIAQDALDAVLASPDQKVPGHGGITRYQSKLEIAGKPYLLRVMVNDKGKRPVVVTLYRTSKIRKYWRQS